MFFCFFFIVVYMVVCFVYFCLSLVSYIFLLFTFVSYVFLLLYLCILIVCILCSVYSAFIVPTGVLRLPSLRVFHAFSSVVRQIPGYNLQRRGTVCTFPNQWIVLFYVLFVGKFVLYYCHRVATQLQLNISYHIKIPRASCPHLSATPTHISQLHFLVRKS
jgi:hypothetical protein